MTPDRTIAHLWRRAAARYGDATAFLVRSGAEWQPVTWTEADRRVERLAHGFLARGIGKGDVVAILARTTLEWVLVDFALAQIGAVSAPVYHTSSPEDVRHVVGHSGSVLVICENDVQAGKVAAMREWLPLLRDVLLYADLAALETEGDAHRAAHPGAVEQAAAAVDEDDLYTIIYTSGTTGPAKGCLIRHRNYYAMAAAVPEIAELELIEQGETLLLYLPLAHNFGRLMLLVGPMIGATIALEPDAYAVGDALLAVRPTVFPSVPRIFEKVFGTVGAAFEELRGPKKALVTWALAVGREVSDHTASGRPLPASLRARHRLADRLVHVKVRARLGGRLRLPISGGAPLAAEIGRFFDSLGLPIYEGYGLTECTSAATVNRPGATRYGTVGQAIPGVELRLEEDNELRIRSETVFAGYHHEPEATAAILDADGWIATGDIATIDADGFVTITDRKKDLIITAGGKNIAPQNLENDLKLSRYVSQALVVGDRRPYAVALVTLDLPEVTAWAKRHDVPTDPAALAIDPRVHTLIQAAVDETNHTRARYEQIKRFAVLTRDFEMAHDELTPTLKLRRRVCLDHFAAEVEALYAEPSTAAAT